MRRPLPDAPAAVAPRPTEPGYRKGQRPPNFGKTYPPEPLTPEEVARLLAATPASGRHRVAGVRNRALIAVIWRCGLRIGEALALYPKDLDLGRRTVTVLRGKGKKRRVVGLDRGTIVLLEQWLAERTELGVPNFERPLFCVVERPNRGGRMRQQLVNDAVKRLARKALIDKRVHPHGFRHTNAFELANENVPVHVIKLHLGHDSLNTTERYISHLAPMTVVRAMQERLWPERVAAERDNRSDGGAHTRTSMKCSIAAQASPSETA